MDQESETWHVEWLAGFLWITRKSDGAERMTRLNSTQTGRCVTRGQFKDSIRTHGFDRACKTFFALGVPV